MSANCSLAVILVTYNRLEKLKKCLSLYEQQSVSFSTLIVINNNSTDGTTQFLNNWKDLSHDFDVIIKNLDENVGGSGGFYEGQNIALSLGVDWVLLADDDAYPDKYLIEKFYSISSKHDLNIPAICTQVKNIDDTIDYSHRRVQFFKRGRLVRRNVPDEIYANKCFDVDLFSYVGAFIRTDALKKVGLVNPTFFIYEDDGEHSLRLKKIGKILCYPELVFIHDSGQNKDLSDMNLVATWRDYYALRNYLFVCIKYYKISAVLLTLSNLIKLAIKKEVRQLKVMKFNAIKDAWMNNLGLHKTYKPGWSIIK